MSGSLQDTFHSLKILWNSKSLESFLLSILKISCLDEGQGITQTLSDRKASWHKSCRDLFSNTKLKHAKKRKLDETEDTERDEKDE